MKRFLCVVVAALVSACGSPDADPKATRAGEYLSFDEYKFEDGKTYVISPVLFSSGRYFYCTPDQFGRIALQPSTRPVNGSRGIDCYETNAAGDVAGFAVKSGRLSFRDFGSGFRFRATSGRRYNIREVANGRLKDRTIVFDQPHYLVLSKNLSDQWGAAFRESHEPALIISKGKINIVAPATDDQLLHLVELSRLLEPHGERVVDAFQPAGSVLCLRDETSFGASHFTATCTVEAGE